MLSNQPEHLKNNRIKTLLCSRCNHQLQTYYTLPEQFLSVCNSNKKKKIKKNEALVFQGGIIKIPVKGTLQIKTAFLQLFSSSLELTAIQNMYLASSHQCTSHMDENFHANTFGSANRAQGKS